jgi:hypothetical protein
MNGNAVRNTQTNHGRGKNMAVVNTTMSTEMMHQMSCSTEPRGGGDISGAGYGNWNIGVLAFVRDAIAVL